MWTGVCHIVNRPNIESLLRNEEIRQSVNRISLKWCGYNFISYVKIVYILKKKLPLTSCKVFFSTFAF